MTSLSLATTARNENRLRDYQAFCPHSLSYANEGAAPGGRLAGWHFRDCEKGGLAVGPSKLGKGRKIMAIAAVTSLPLAVTVDSASPHETKLIEETLAGSSLDELPARLIGDRAYDSDPLDRRLERIMASS